VVHISDILHADQLHKDVDAGYIRAQRHPTLPLTIYNYTPSAMYDSHWDSATLMARGLILDDLGMVVARPFQKFFNLGEQAMPKFVVSDTPARIYEKLDGSLGILYCYDGEVGVATRGSFTSDQAVWATNWLDRMNWADGIGHGLYRFWPAGVTPLVEIIYPQNRIVVDYKGAEKLVMLGAIRNSDGSDMYPGEIVPWWPWSFASEDTPSGIQDITHMVNSEQYEGNEGVVMVWYRPGEPSYRLKVKRADYVEMHRLVTGMTARRVWTLAKKGHEIEDIIKSGVPEEFADWVRNKYSQFVDGFAKRIMELYDDFIDVSNSDSVMENNGTTVDRKKFAMVVKKCKDASYMFALLDGKDITESVWDELYPAHEVPFANPEEV